VRLSLSHVCVKTVLSAIFVWERWKGVWFYISVLFTIPQNWKTFVWNCISWTLWRPLINLLTSVPTTEIQFEDITLGRKFLTSEITRCSKRYLFFSFENHFTVCIYFQVVPSPHQRIAFHGSKRKVFCPCVRIKFQSESSHSLFCAYAKYIICFYT
jgi:hypothetical protein